MPYKTEPLTTVIKQWFTKTQTNVNIKIGMHMYRDSEFGNVNSKIYKWKNITV